MLSPSDEGHGTIASSPSHDPRTNVPAGRTSATGCGRPAKYGCSPESSGTVTVAGPVVVGRTWFV